MQGMSHMALRIRRDERLRCAVRHGPEVLRRLRRRGHRARGDLRAGAAEGREAFGAFGAAISRGATALNVAFCTHFTWFFEFFDVFGGFSECRWLRRRSCCEA